MPRPTIYLDSSVPNALLDSRDPIRQEQTKLFWGALEEFEVQISTLVVDELTRTGRGDTEKRDELIHLIQGITVLDIDDDAHNLAERYIAAGVVTSNHFDDALHLACASRNGLDFVVSWNFRHMVRVRTRKLVNAVNALNGYREIEIVAPIELDFPDMDE